jgi:uncharacterized protein YnzC (UPF0291/DUF896 family)
MILRRLTDAFRKQDWFTVAVETLIVVFGVFIGLQVSNWNEERGLTQKEAVVLEALSQDLEGAIESFDAFLLRIERQTQRQLELAEVVDGIRSDVTPAELDALVSDAVYLLLLPEPRRASVEDLKTSGQINLIRNADIRKRIVALEPIIVDVEQSMDEQRRLVFDKVDSYLIGNYDLRGIANGSGTLVTESAEQYWPVANFPRESQLGLVRTLEFRNLLIYRMMQLSGLDFTLQQLRLEYRETNEMVHARLRELGKAP